MQVKGFLVIVITQARVLCLIYTHDARGRVRIYQAKYECLCYNHFRHSQNLPKLDARCSAALYSKRYWL